MNNSIGYEIHVTVGLFPLGKKRFDEACARIGAKPIVIDLEVSSGDVVQQDVMTSSKYCGDDAGAFAEMKRIRKLLGSEGFTVLREKIESEPGHALAPQQSGHVMPASSYFESHVAYLIQPSEKELLQEIVARNGARISRNPFKKTDEGTVFLVTLRDRTSPFCAFRAKLDALLSDAQTCRFVPHKKIEVEFAVYDSNLDHDAAWIK